MSDMAGGASNHTSHPRIPVGSSAEEQGKKLTCSPCYQQYRVSSTQFREPSGLYIALVGGKARPQEAQGASHFISEASHVEVGVSSYGRHSPISKCVLRLKKQGIVSKIMESFLVFKRLFIIHSIYGIKQRSSQHPM